MQNAMIATIFFVLCCLPIRAQHITVGSSPTDTFSDIQSALDAALTGTGVVVNPGEYVIDEPINFNRLHDPNDPTSPKVKNVNLVGYDATIRMDTPKDPNRASVFIFENGETPYTTIQGFTIKGGRGTNLLFLNNPTRAGGGILIRNSSPMIFNCVITENTLNGGNGFYGAGIYLENSSTEISHSKVEGNNGAGVFVERGSPTIINSVIMGNDGHGYFGVGCFDGSAPKLLINCVIAGNSKYGAGDTGCATFLHCTFAGNKDGAVDCYFQLPTIISCIAWDNGPNYVCANTFWTLEKESPRFVRSGVFDFWKRKPRQDPHSIGLPDFVVEEPNYRLQKDSPAIDVGLAFEERPYDLGGMRKFFGTAPDLGAYEYYVFRRGDANADGDVDISDALFVLIDWYFGTLESSCEKTGNFNNDNLIDISDPIYALNFLFLGGPPPPPPFAGCGQEDQAGRVFTLGCEGYEPCE